ncbi:MAG: hypothetical protein EXS59_02965 [Candidatus Taylorbacteria bacterium]|nr:hypothetical protein [Candidatus Taylorbacteria bacterium]
MRFANKILTAGVFIIVLPFLGLPTSWKNFFLFIIGAWLCVVYFSIRSGTVNKGKKSSSSGARRTHSKAISFVENKPIEFQSTSISSTLPNINEENQ